MMEVFEAEPIENFNRFFGFDTRHPLVAIVNFNSENNHKVHHIMRADTFVAYFQYILPLKFISASENG